MDNETKFMYFLTGYLLSTFFCGMGLGILWGGSDMQAFGLIVFALIIFFGSYVISWKTGMDDIKIT